MSLSKRATVYFDPEVHKALKMKAVETSTSISVLLDKLVRQEFLEDQEDLKIFNDRAAEPSITYEKLISDLKKNGKI
ncbi:MAG: CopG family transcriptional regulator [Ignavibacteriae bacterium]|jgi:predicted transcriptional regulator|nr:CopG family transcriptional regulator [Ignavibacteriota bacterium]NOG98885.1 CopG family transcriptional regulator [Ignavibacteriota bacterium]